MQTYIADTKTISEEEIHTVVDLINRVYLDSEKDFWPHNGDYERTNVSEIKTFIKENELIVAKLDNEIIGAVHMYKIDDTTGGYGMLVSAPEKRGLKIGKALMNAIEEWFLNENIQQIQIEILKPAEILHPEKEFIEAWYKRLGYQLISKTPYGELYPDNSHLLRIPCTFYIYKKTL